MTPQDAALLASLKGFTPGPWRVRPDPEYGMPTLLLSSGGYDIATLWHGYLAADSDAALIAAAPDLHRIATEQAVEIERLRDQVNKMDRDRRLVEAQVDRLLAMANRMDDDYRSLQLAAESLGAMPEGYCFCSKDRIGDDSKIHEPECAELRATLEAGQ